MVYINCFRILYKASFKRLIHKSPKMHRDPGTVPRECWTVGASGRVIGSSNLWPLNTRSSIFFWDSLRVGWTIPIPFIVTLSSSSPLISRNGHTHTHKVVPCWNIANVYWLVYLNIIACKFGISSFSGCHLLCSMGVKQKSQVPKGL